MKKKGRKSMGGMGKKKHAGNGKKIQKQKKNIWKKL